MKTLREMMDIIESAQTVAEADETSWTANSAKFGDGYENVPLQKSLHNDLVAKYLPWVKKEIANGSRIDSALNSVEHHLQTKDKLKNYNQVKDIIAAISQEVDGPFHKEPFYKGQDEEQLEETTDEAVAKVESLFKNK